MRRPEPDFPALRAQMVAEQLERRGISDRRVLEAMVATTTSWLVNGRPRQFMVIWEKSRCSILLHFDVPGG